MVSWSPPKRFPTALTFDRNDASMVNLVTALAHLMAEVYGIEKPSYATQPDEMAKAIEGVYIEPFQPKANVKIETDPKATAKAAAPADGMDDEARIAQLLEQVSTGLADAPLGSDLSPIVFEKDDDTNYHMDVISGLANMRARNYRIDEVDKLQAKLIAGRIVPAIATTTAVATGLVCLELYKVLLGKEKLEDYRNTFCNLALPLFAMAEPVPMKNFTFESGDTKLSWSLWDRWVIEGDVTMKEVLDWFEAKGLTAYSVSAGASLLYNAIFPKHKERLDKKVSELFTTIAKIEIPPQRSHFDVVVACEDDDGEDIDVPLLSIQYR